MKASAFTTPLVSPFSTLTGPKRLTVILEQISPTKIKESVNASDVYRMWATAASGFSAKLIRPDECPASITADGKIRVQLGFYAWPSELDLDYTLTSSIGTIGPRISVRIRREDSYVVNNSRILDLPYYLDIDSIVSWQSPAYDRNGRRVSTPAHTSHHTWIEFEEEVFGVVRVSGTAIGHRYVLTMLLDKGLTEVEKTAQEQLDEAYERLRRSNTLMVSKPTKMVGNRITGLNATVTASWIDERGANRESTADLKDHSQLRLALPTCVDDLLSMCPDEFNQILSILCVETSTRQVYYSTCSGEVIYIHDGKNPTSFCSEVDGSAAWSWGIGL